MMALQTGQDKMARNPLNLCGQKGVLVRRDEEPLEVDITQYAEALQPDILSALEGRLYVLKYLFKVSFSTILRKFYNSLVFTFFGG